MGNAVRAVMIAIVGLIAGSTVVQAETFQPGEVIEYKVGGAYPERWERGVIVRVLPEGKQYLIRQKPTQFFAEGAETAFAVADLRRPKDEKPAQAGGASAASPFDSAAYARKPAPAPPCGEGADGGLLSKDQVIAHARLLMGANPFTNPIRDSILERIRDYVKSCGTNFGTDDDFRARMDAQGTMSSHIGWAVDSNRGARPKLDDYFGTWLLRAASRGSTVVSQANGRTVARTTDSQAESGRLTIHADRTYVWEVLRGDPEEKWLRGRWREVVPEELNAWEAGPAIWLEKAKQGDEYMVRMGRDPEWPGWIDVGAGKARTPVEYGRRP
ncbi:MAG: hypothetical protein HYV63_32430 [Candidatus Schekmanbacteria bacterium]|nr:hypothetical protein [Candidatus Schekmanbacteria bacterium]